MSFFKTPLVTFFLFLNFISLDTFANSFSCSSVLSEQPYLSHYEVGQRIITLMNQGRHLPRVVVTPGNLASVTGVSRSYIYNVLNGSKALKDEHARKIATFTGLSIQTLFTPINRKNKFWIAKDGVLKQALRDGIEIPSYRRLPYSLRNIADRLSLSIETVEEILTGKIALTEAEASTLESFFEVERGWLVGSGPTFRLQIKPTEHYTILHPDVQKAFEVSEKWKHEIGKRLLILMLSSPTKVKQSELADYLGVRQNFISRVINGTRTLHLEHATLLASYFDVEASWLLATDLIISNTDILVDARKLNAQNFRSLMNIADHFNILNR